MSLAARLIHRALSLTLGALVVAGCRDEATDPSGLRYATVSLAPVFPGAASPAQVAHIRFVLERSGEDSGTVAVDTTVNLAPTQDSIVVAIRVPLLAPQELFLLTLTLTNASGEVLYVGGPVSILVSSTSGAGPPISVPLLPRPDSLSVVSGDAQQGPIGSPLPLPLVVRVLDADGIGFPGVSVAFTPTSGSVSPQTVVSDSMGNAQTSWTLGSASGQQSVTVSVSGNPTLTATFRATALLLGPDSLIVVSGDSQAAPIGSPLPLPLVARVLDASGGGLPGVSVAFSPTDGSVSPQSAVSDSGGNARTSWTLGSAAGPQSVTASVSGNPPLTATFRATALLPPQPGADIVVLNDINVFDNIGMVNPNNRQLVRNLIGFTSGGPRSDSTELWFDVGRNSPCGVGCGAGPSSFLDTTLNIIGQAGFTITEVSSTSGSITIIPPTVKAVFLWLPKVAFTLGEVNVLRQFAAEGGRIVFIGEGLGTFQGAYDTTAINTENQFLRDMGAQMTNTGGAIDCIQNQGDPYPVLPQSSLRSHQITQGLTGLTIACASVIVPGPGDFPLFYDLTNTQLLAGVATVGAQPAPAYDSEAARQAAFEREVRRQEATPRRPAAAGADPALGARLDRRP
jgi:hypothetical protein